MGNLISVAVRLQIPLQFVSFIVYLAYSAFNVTGTIPFKLKRLSFPLHPVTSRYIIVRHIYHHHIHMNLPGTRFGPGSVHGRACQGGHILYRSPARSSQALGMNQVGSTMMYSRAGKKPVCFIPGPVYTGSVLIEVKPGHIPTSTHY